MRPGPLGGGSLHRVGLPYPVNVVATMPLPLLQAATAAAGPVGYPRIGTNQHSLRLSASRNDPLIPEASRREPHEGALRSYLSTTGPRTDMSGRGLLVLS